MYRRYFGYLYYALVGVEHQNMFLWKNKHMNTKYCVNKYYTNNTIQITVILALKAKTSVFLRQVVTKCRTIVMQRAPGAFCITFILHLVTACHKQSL